MATWNLLNWTSNVRKTQFPLGFGYLWMKLYRTAFLRQHHLCFREDFYCKADVIFHWKTMSLAERVSLVPESLYHYRVHPDSVTGTIGRRYTQIVHVMEAIHDELSAIGDPKALLTPWYPFALDCIRSAYEKVPASHRGR